MNISIHNLDIYERTIKQIQMTPGDHYKNLPDEVWESLPEESQEDVMGWEDLEYEPNAGLTWESGRTIFVLYSVQSSFLKAVNVRYHEVRHVVDKITRHCEIEDDEAAAYLQGYLGEVFHKFLCECYDISQQEPH